MRISGETKGDYNNFISLMDAPALETLSIDFTAGSILSMGGDCLGAMALSFGRRPVFPKLRHFVLRLSGTYEFEDYDIMGEFFKRMPNLEELEVYGANPKVMHYQWAQQRTNAYPWKHYPSLRRITIHLWRSDPILIRRTMHSQNNA